MTNSRGERTLLVTPWVTLIGSLGLGYWLSTFDRHEPSGTSTQQASAVEASEQVPDTAVNHWQPHAAPESQGSSGRRSLEEPREEQYKRRAPEEWQGRPQDVRFREPCNDFGSCGYARACVNGVCGPCDSDSDCLQGERCVLDSCLLAEAVSCRTRADCGAEELCLIEEEQGSNGWRGNGVLFSGCSKDARVRAAAVAQTDSASQRRPTDAPDRPADPTAILTVGKYEQMRKRVLDYVSKTQR